MKFERIASIVEGVPYMSPHRGRLLYDFLIENRPDHCLELGFAHGVSTCYMSAALDEVGHGEVTGVDLAESRDRSPSAEELLERAGLSHLVTLHREASSYTWFLKKEIEKNTQNGSCNPMFDFCFIDGAKNWTIDGLAFFLADKLLKTGGWVLFDDFRWTYQDHASQGKPVCDGITIRELAEDERVSPHVESIFRLLVMQHPSYSNFKIQDDTWGWAQKIASDHKTLSIEESESLQALIMRHVRRMKLLRRGGR